MQVKKERLFLFFYEPGVLNAGPTEWAPSDVGREQFVKHQSKGIEPEVPDPFYTVLTGGKRLFDFICKQLLDLWRSESWWGLHLIWLDWEGDRWVLPHILSWWEKETNCRLPYSLRSGTEEPWKEENVQWLCTR